MDLKFIVGSILTKMISCVLPARLMRSKKYFDTWEKKGYHVTPVDYYEPVPDTLKLGNKPWEKCSRMTGVEINEEKQLMLLSGFVSEYKNEYDKIPFEKTKIPYEYYFKNSFYEGVDAEILYCMIRHFKPKFILEAGSGNSTFLSAKAVLKNKENFNIDCNLTACDPYPNDVLRAGFPGLTNLNIEKAENIPMEVFNGLGENDILFIDSSHVLKIGSDVQFIYSEVLPGLKKGVLVHIHDIFLPAEYSKDWVLKHHRFWTEQYLLQAFLCFNKSFEILWAGSYMHLNHHEILNSAFNSYKHLKNIPLSFWIRKIE